MVLLVSKEAFQSLTVSANTWFLAGLHSVHFACRGCFFRLHIPIPSRYLTCSIIQHLRFPSYTILCVTNPSSSLPTSTLIDTSTCLSMHATACRLQCTSQQGTPPSSCVSWAEFPLKTCLRSLGWNPSVAQTSFTVLFTWSPFAAFS